MQLATKKHLINPNFITLIQIFTSLKNTEHILWKKQTILLVSPHVNYIINFIIYENIKSTYLLVDNFYFSNYEVFQNLVIVQPEVEISQVFRVIGRFRPVSMTFDLP